MKKTIIYIISYIVLLFVPFIRVVIPAPDCVVGPCGGGFDGYVSILQALGISPVSKGYFEYMNWGPAILYIILAIVITFVIATLVNRLYGKIFSH